jgi:hypothetical protein
MITINGNALVIHLIDDKINPLAIPVLILHRAAGNELHIAREQLSLNPHDQVFIILTVAVFCLDQDGLSFVELHPDDTLFQLWQHPAGTDLEGERFVGFFLFNLRRCRIGW